MIVIGGLGSVAGAVIGAAFVSLLPQLLTRYSDALPLVSAPGTGGVSPGEASRYLYGAAVVAVVLFLPGGLVGIAARRPQADVRPGSEESGGATMSSRTRKRRHRGGPALAALLALAACSSQGDRRRRRQAGRGRGQDRRRASPAKTITLGVLTDMTGVYATLGKSVTQAQQLYVEADQHGRRHLRPEARTDRPRPRLRPAEGGRRLHRAGAGGARLRPVHRLALRRRRQAAHRRPGQGARPAAGLVGEPARQPVHPGHRRPPTTSRRSTRSTS